MTERTMIIAISEYYGISTMEAATRYRNRTEPDEYDHVYEWYVDRIDEKG